MKLKIRSLVIVLVLVCILTSQAFAITFYYRASSGYDLIWSDDFVFAEIMDLLTTQEFTAICNATPYASSYTYKVVISYDELAGLVTTANTHQLNTSLYRNDAAGYWVAKVHDYDDNSWFSNDNTPRVLGNPNGYVYVAEIDTTGEDTVSLLDSILVRLTLVESYVKSTYFELWEQGQVLDSYFDMLAVMQNSLENIDSDTSSIVSKLTTIASSLSSNGNSITYYVRLFNNNMLTRTADIIEYQAAAATDLDTMITKLTSVDADLDTMITKLTSVDADLDTMITKLTSVDADLDTVIKNQNTFYPYFASIDSELDLTTDLLIEIYNNISSLIISQNVANTSLSNIESLLTYNEYSAANIMGYVNNNLLLKTGEIIDQQEAAAAKLDTVITKLTAANTSLSTIATEITSADSRLGTVVTKITSVDTNIASALFYNDTSIAALLREMSINMGLQHTLLQNDLGDANTHLSNLHSDLLIWLMNDQVGLISKLNALVEKQEVTNTSLSNIEDLLTYNEKSAGYIMGQVNNNMLSRTTTIINNQVAAAAKLDSVITALTSSNTSLSTIASEITSADDRLSTVVTKVTAMDTNLSSVVTKITSADSRLNTVNTNLITMISNQSELLELLQEDGVFTTDISGILTDLDSLLSNQSTLVTSLAGVSTNLSSVVTKITSVDSRLNTANTNLTTMISNQSELLTLLQEDGVFTSDLSGVLTNQQKLIDLLEELNDTAVENIQNITIDVTNEAYEIFYITDGNGNEQNLGDFSGDILTISGRLLNFFFKVAFDDAMNSVDSALDDMTGFYLDDSVVLEGGSLWE